MPPAFRQIMVALLVLAQAALGAAPGGFVCLGHVGEPEATIGCSCDHSTGSEGWPMPVPVEPHQDDEGCPCIDIAAPVGRIDLGRASDDLMRDSAVLALPPLPSDLASPAPPRRTLCRADQRPPGPAPGLRTTRLLL